MNVHDLISRRQCTPACVVADSSPARCRCVCGGTLHGLVGAAHVDTLIEARRNGYTRLSDDEILAGVA